MEKTGANKKQKLDSNLCRKRKNPADVEVILNSIPTEKEPQHPKRRTNQTKSWFFTFNNYTEEDIITLKNKFDEDIFEKYIFEKEVGESGTPHLQGCVFCKTKTRWSEFNLSKNINWSKVRDEERAIKYCQKDYQSLGNELWYKNIQVRERLELINPNRPYQKMILNILTDKPDNRTIHWFYEPNGNVGKSSLVKYLVLRNGSIFIDEGKKTDIMNTTLTFYNAGNTMKSFIFDIPRQNKNKISWKSIESIKNGLIYSPKYEGGVASFNSPHVIIFSNFKPDIDEFTLSADRIKCYRIDEQTFETIEEEI